MTVKFTMRNAKAVPDGTVLMFGVRYEGMTPAKTFTYAMLKAGGLWYVTGSGRVPIAATWLAVERWLDKDGRVVEWVKVVTETAQIHPTIEAPEVVDVFEIGHTDLLGSPGSAGSEQD